MLDVVLVVFDTRAVLTSAVDEKDVCGRGASAPVFGGKESKGGKPAEDPVFCGVFFTGFPMGHSCVCKSSC